MPRVLEAMKDVVSCDKPGGAAHKRIPGSPNGTTQSRVNLDLHALNP